MPADHQDTPNRPPVPGDAAPSPGAAPADEGAARPSADDAASADPGFATNGE